MRHGSRSNLSKQPFGRTAARSQSDPSRRAGSGLSLLAQTKMVNLKKADVLGCEATLAEVRCDEDLVRALFFLLDFDVGYAQDMSLGSRPIDFGPLA